MLLPTQKTPPKSRLSDFTILAHGKPKLGKSSMCAQAEDALFLATEAGLNSLDVYQVPIATWEDLLAACAEIAEGKHGFKTVVLDTVDNAFRMATVFVCQKFKIDHESDAPYGKAYAAINHEFYRVLNKLALLPYGLFLISHSQEIEIETRTGKINRVVPTLPDKARKLVLGMVDIILYCDLETTTDADGKPTVRRVMRTKPHVHYEAGDRTGRLPEVIDLDYHRFVAAFEGAVGAPPSASSPGSTSIPVSASVPVSAPTPVPSTPAIPSTPTASKSAAPVSATTTTPAKPRPAGK